MDETLRRYGIRLLEGEQIQRVLDRKRGLVEQRLRNPTGFVITTHRLIHLSREGGRRRAYSAMIRDVSHLDIEHQGRSLGFLVMTVIAVLGAPAAYVGLEGNDVATYAAAGAAVVGLIFLVLFLGSGRTSILTHIGARPVHVPIAKPAIGDAEQFAADFFEAKSRPIASYQPRP